MSGRDDLSGVGQMPDEMPWRTLTPARLRAGLSTWDLYLRYVALGGLATSKMLFGHFSKGAELATNEHNLIVLALNERFLEIDAQERLPYMG